MKQANLIFATLVILVLCITGSEKAKTPQNPDMIESPDDYTIDVYIPEPLNADEYEFANLLGHNIGVVSVSDMESDELEERINLTLYYEALSWVVDEMLPTDNNIKLPSILFHNDRYLSVVNEYHYYYPRSYCIYDYITVDLTTGERVFLDDLVEVNDEFINYLRTEEKYEKEFTWTDFETTKEQLEQCSMTQQEIMANSGTHTSLIYFFRDSFYLKNGRIVIMQEDRLEDEGIEIDCSDIKQFLKVEPW